MGIIETILFDHQKFFILESLLINLSQIYSRDSLDNFNYNYDNLNEEYQQFIDESINVEIEDLAKDEQDIIEFAREVYYLKNPIKIEKSDPSRVLTLRNAEDIIKFESFLDKLIRIDELDHDEFLNLLPLAPVEYYDKIDDLRETSKKSQRDSESFTRCLDKAKRISMSYSNG